MLDLDELDLTSLAEKPFKVVLKHPVTMKPLSDDDGEQYFMVYGRDSKLYEKEYRKLFVKKNIQEQEKPTRKLSEKERELRIEQDKELEVQLIAKMVDSGRLYLKGEWIDVDKSSALEYLSKFTWMPEQLNIGILDRKNILNDHKKK